MYTVVGLFYGRRYVTVWFLCYTVCSVMGVAVWQSDCFVYIVCDIMDVGLFYGRRYVAVWFLLCTLSMILWT